MTRIDIFLLLGTIFILIVIGLGLAFRRQKQTGPVHDHQTASQDQGSSIDPWPWMKGIGICIVLVIVGIALFMYSAVIASAIAGAWASLPAFTWTMLVTTALVLLVLAYVFKDLVFKNIVVRGLQGGALVLLWLALIVPVITWWNTPSAPRHYTQPRQEWGLAVAPTSPCDSQEVPYTFEANKPVQPFNRAGQCGPVLWYKGHCVWALGFKSSIPVKLCDKPGQSAGDVPLNLEYVWSADGYAFQDKYRLDPPRTTAILTIVR